MKIISFLVFFCALVLSAQPWSTMAQGPQGSPLRPTQISGGISFLSGGVGEKEAAEMKRLAKSYNLRLHFSGKHGESIANVQVMVKNSQGGVILDTKSQGPYFFALLPGGAYQISVSYEGQTQMRDIRLEKKQGSGSELTFTW